MFHRFPWSIFVTDALLSDLEARFGPAPSGGRDDLRRMLPRLFQHVGGLPITEVLHEKTAEVETKVDQALEHCFATKARTEARAKPPDRRSSHRVSASPS